MKTFRITLLLALITTACQLNAQPKTVKKDSAKTALIAVGVVDAKKQPRKGEQVIFQSVKAGKNYSGKTNAEGKFSVTVPVGDDYKITIKALTDTSQYGQINIPALDANSFYKDPFTVNITYEPPHSFTLNNVHFDIAKATLKPASIKELQELTAYLKWKEEEKIEIAGHTDNEGQEAANLKLSQQRAEAVRNYLIKNGIAASRVIAKGYGSSIAVADNATEEGRQKNRRTEVKIL